MMLDELDPNARKMLVESLKVEAAEEAEPAGSADDAGPTLQ